METAVGLSSPTIPPRVGVDSAMDSFFADFMRKEAMALNDNDSARTQAFIRELRDDPIKRGMWLGEIDGKLRGMGSRRSAIPRGSSPAE